MEIKSASKSLAALAHETRLAIFRLLVQAGPEGINAGMICEKLALPAATLSFHLAHLSRSGLICGRQEGRFIFYVADYAAMDELLAYLTHNCCQGAQCLPKTTAGSTALKRRRTAAAR
jgi:DNA-binding transcriptional ArsR family regulator